MQLRLDGVGRRCGRSGSDTIVGDTIAVAFLAMVCTMHAAGGGRVVIIIADMKPKSGRVDVAVAPEKKSAEDRLSHDIENPIEDGFRVWSDDVAALTQSPGDGVEEPKEDSPDAADRISAGDVTTEGDGVFASGPGDGPCNPKESGTAEDEIGPLEYH